MKKLFLLFALLCAPAFGQVYSEQAMQNTQGNWLKSLPGALVYLCNSSAVTTDCLSGIGPLVTLYTDQTLTVSGSNPVTADSNGNYTLFTFPGIYLQCVKGATSFCQMIQIGGNGVVSCANALNGSLAAFTSTTNLSCDPLMGTDFAGNGFAQSWRYLGPVNGFVGVIGGGSDPGTLAKYKLSANEFRWLGNTIATPFYGRVPGTHCTPGQVWQVVTNSADANGDTIDNFGCLTPSGGVSITATSPIVVTPSPITGTGVISCPTCGTASYPNAGNPLAPTVTPTGVTGATNYSYVVVGDQEGAGQFHSTASSTGSTSTGNATLTTSNYNLLTGYGDTLYGYRCFDIYRTVGGATQGLIARCAGKALKDTGLTGDGTTAPTSNNSQLDPLGLIRPGSLSCNSIPHSPDGVDAPPCTPNALDMEMSRTFGVPGDVNDGTLTWGGGGTSPCLQNSATAAWTNGALTITSDTTNKAVECLEFSTPSTPYTFLAWIDAISQNTPGMCGIGFRESSTGKMATWGLLNNQSTNSTTGSGGWITWPDHWTNSTTDSITTSYISYQSSNGYFKLQNDGTNIVYSFSNTGDGVNFKQFLSEAKTVPFTTGPNQVILFALGATAGPTTCTFDFERRTQ